MISKKGIISYILCLIALTALLSTSCRRNQPSLVDANRGPDTELWNAPPVQTDFEYLVHLYWRGVDDDGTVEKCIWTKTDTIIAGEMAWNPADRLRDFRSGRVTYNTDSVFSFTAYKSTGGGLGLKKNRQAFHVASIDNNGVIDDSPARIEFVATIDKLPFIKFRVWQEEILPSCSSPSGYTKQWKEIEYKPDAIPTVGMFRPFKIAYEGATENGLITQYQWFPLSLSIELEGASIWSRDLADTLRDFPNTGNNALPSGIFRFAAQCEDEADARSITDAGRFTEGVCQIVVNFDPQTEIIDVINTYYIDGDPHQRTILFDDAFPDTIPYRSWVRLRYRGSNDTTVTIDCPGGPRDIILPRDSSICQDDTNQCIRYQMSFHRFSERFPYSEARTSWLPEGGEDNDRFGVTDSTSINVGSVEYEVFVRSLDEYGKPDGTPAKIDLVGNYDPVLDSVYIMDHMGNRVLEGDTIYWNWWKPANTDTFNEQTIKFEKFFYFSVNAFGHDHPTESGGGVKNWLYYFFDLDGVFNRFARAGAWVLGQDISVISDSMKVTFSYSPLDPTGNEIFADPPSWVNKTYDLVIKGRDTFVGEEYRQFMFIQGAKVLINSYPHSNLGRWTGEETLRFHLKFFRP